MDKEKFLNYLSVKSNIAFRDDKYTTVSILMKSYLQHRVNDAQAWFIFGEALSNLGKYKNAESALLTSLELGAKDKDCFVFLSLADLYFNFGKFEKAEEFFHKVIEIDPDSGYLWVLRGVNVAQIGNFTLAEKYYRHALTLCDVAKDEAYLNLGNVLRVQERYPEAIAVFKDCLRLEPAETKVQEALRELEGLDEDIASGNRLIGEGNWDGLYKMIIDAFKSEKQSIVIHLLPGYFKHRTDRTYAWYMYGESLRLVGRFQEAEQAFLKSLEAASKKQICRVYGRLGMLYSNYGKYEEAEEYFLKVTKDDEYEKLGWVWLERGLNLVKCERFSSAENCFRKAIILGAADKKDVYSNLGYALRAQEKYKEAAGALEEYLKIVPGDDLVRVELDDLQQVEEYILLANSIPDS